jgi:glucose-6-phosphate isomerase
LPTATFLAKTSGMMNTSKADLWKRFQQYYTEYPSLALALDLSRMNFSDDFFASMEPRMQKAFQDMAALEAGVIANPDENRMVGHYWLRAPELAPNAEIRREIGEMQDSIHAFADSVHTGQVHGQDGPFENLLVIGIGGSALGPQFVANALGHPKKDKLKVFFFDNTDPDGMDRTLAALDGKLGRTLCVVISKSGGTKETRNGMVEAELAYMRAQINLPKHAVAVTGIGSELDNHAEKNSWLKRFPMWDWVGGRTSELSAVGLLPAALQGIDIKSLISGAKICDEVTRQPVTAVNPAAQIALAIYQSGNGKGQKSMVVLPYKDRLELFSKYLQQLIMESLGKEKDLTGSVVNQGLSVFGNKGATDQHSYIQQLREGINNFFAVFIEVLKDRDHASSMVEPGVTSGDFLNGFFQGTRRALFENGRESVTITVDQVSPFSVGVLIALFERTVGLYANLTHINAYHQPGVEAGKKAAGEIIKLQSHIIGCLKANKHPQTITEIANSLNSTDNIEIIFKICNHLAANPDHGIKKTPGSNPFDSRYHISA